MKVGCWEEGNGIIVKEDGTARAEQFNVCVCVCLCCHSALSHLQRERNEGRMCLEDMGFEHRGYVSFRPSSERADLTE